MGCFWSERSCLVRSVLSNVVSLCEWPSVTLLTIIDSYIFSLNSTDGQSEISPRYTCTETIWNSRLTNCCIINQEFRSFSRFLKIPVNVITYASTGFTSNGDSLSWSSRLRSRRLSQDDFSWWTWKPWTRRDGLLRQIQLGERWSTWKQKSIISLTWRIDGRR